MMKSNNKLITLLVLICISAILLLILIIVTPKENFDPDKAYPTLGITYIPDNLESEVDYKNETNQNNGDNEIGSDTASDNHNNSTGTDQNVNDNAIGSDTASDNNYCLNEDNYKDNYEDDYEDDYQDDYEDNYNSDGYVENIRPNEDAGVETVVIPTMAPNVVSENESDDKRTATLKEIMSRQEVKYHLIEDFPHLLQNPELPTGCEITSLTMVLNYLGFEIDKMEVLKYLPCGANRKTNPNKAYVGNPQTANGFGCNSPVIAKVALDFFEDVRIDMEVSDLENCTAEDLFDYLLNDIPVIVWANIGMIESTKLLKWTADDGEKIEILNQEHCLVLIGFDINKKQFLFADPLKEVEVKTYGMERFLRLFEARGSQAIVIR